MKALIYNIFLQWKLDFRNKDVLIVYYAVPLVFYLVMSSVFITIDPNSKNTIIQSMSIFSISMGALIGTPHPLIELFSSDIKKTYKVSNIPLWTLLFTTFISTLIHLLIVSLIILISAPLIYNANIPSNIPFFLAMIILFISISTIIGLILGITCKKNSTATMISQSIFLPTIILSGIMFPSNLLPEFLEKIAYILPSTHILKLLTNTYSNSNILTLCLILIFILLILGYKYKKLQMD